MRRCCPGQLSGRAPDVEAAFGGVPQRATFAAKLLRSFASLGGIVAMQ
jgi:hypothetical protein